MPTRRWVSVVAATAFVAALGTPAVASAVTRYAEPGTGGSNTACPQSDPCDLEEAVESAAVGDEIVILTGAYTLADPLVVSGAGTVVRGEANQPHPLIQTSAFTGVVASNSGSTVRDLAIRHSGAGNALIAYGTAERVDVRSTSAVAISACHLGFLSRLRDSACSTTAGTVPAMRAFMSGAFTNTLRLRNVTAVSAGGHGLVARAEDGEDLTVDVKATIARGGGGFADVKAETDGALSTSVTVTLEHSNYATVIAEASTTITAAGSVTNQTSTPGFVNAAAGDFHQVTPSRTINGGVVDANSGTTDLDGEPRTQGSAPDIGAYEYDQIAPVVSITAGPAAGETIDVSSATFEFTSDEAGVTFACSLNASGPVPCSGPGNTHTFSDIPNGGHGANIRAFDENGNIGLASRSFIVSVPSPPPPPTALPPQTTITKSPPKKTEKTKAKFKFTSSAAGSTFECKLDKGSYRPCTSPRKFKRLDEAKHKFRVRAIDPAGIADPSPAKDKWKVVG